MTMVFLLRRRRRQPQKSRITGSGKRSNDDRHRPVFFHNSGWFINYYLFLELLLTLLLMMMMMIAFTYGRPIPGGGGLNVKKRRPPKPQPKPQESPPPPRPRPPIYGRGGSALKQKVQERKMLEEKFEKEKQQQKQQQDTCKLRQPKFLEESTCSSKQQQHLQQHSFTYLFDRIDESIVRERIVDPLYKLFIQLLLYKLPVGFVIVLMSWRVFRIASDHVWCIILNYYKKRSNSNKISKLSEEEEVVEDAGCYDDATADEYDDDESSVKGGLPMSRRRRRLIRRRRRRKRQRLNKSLYGYVFGQMPNILEPNDRAYSECGGVQSIRSRLCLAAFTTTQEDNSTTQPSTSTLGGGGGGGGGGSKQQQQQQGSRSEQHSDASTQRELLRLALKDALEVSACGDAASVIPQWIDTLHRLDSVWQGGGGGTDGNSNGRKTRKFPLQQQQQIQLEDQSYWTVQVRGTDALLRMLRNRLLLTSHRLTRTVERRIRRVTTLQDLLAVRRHLTWTWLGRFLQRRENALLQQERLRLADVKASYLAEVERLGRVVAMLLDEPSDLSDKQLLEAIQTTKKPEQDAIIANDEGRNINECRRSGASSSSSAGSSDNSGRSYSIRWTADGMGRLDLDQVQSQPVEGSSAMKTLAGDDQDFCNSSDEWVRQARRLMCTVVRECWKTSKRNTSTVEARGNMAFGDDGDEDILVQEEVQILRSAWYNGSSSSSSSSNDRKNVLSGATPFSSSSTSSQTKSISPWKVMGEYIDLVPVWRRIGEGKAVRLLSTTPIHDALYKIDVLGIPSSLLIIYLASCVHTYTQPHWLTWRKMAIEFVSTVVGICNMRVYKPVKGIVDDILNRNVETPGFVLDDEQDSLDRMLRDLGCFGPNYTIPMSPDERREAMGEARDLYEADLKKGFIRTIVRGQLLRLLLIQVQQLKVALLSALDIIDTLLKNNRINFQILATIPAVLLTWALLRFLFRSIYNIRAKDLRPVTFVHADMLEYLEKVESILLLNDPILAPYVSEPKKNRQSGGDKSIKSSTTLVAKTLPLGELTLNMHRYLLQLNLSSPPFPSSKCDQIHDWIVEILSFELQEENAARKTAWVNRIKQKHQDLLQYL